tara:strand:- start:4837 stop:5277 length:441 start_codon:yes stop_codon:yes gene_type:complete
MSNEYFEGEMLTPSELLSMTTDIVSAYVSNNTIDSDEIRNLVHNVYSSLNEIGTSSHPSLGRPEPSVALEDSITDDYIICLEDGKKLKMLKRHLKTAYNMTPDQYRERWGLSADYPMVAPNYAKQRSSLAVKIGLGRKRKKMPQAA